jgi:hypothetical protein
MANKKHLAQETASPVIVENQFAIPVEDSNFKNLCKNLKKIRNLKGVLGYIVRNGVSAEIDLKEPEKLLEYALFTSQLVDSSQEIAETLNLGDIITTLAQGKDIKVVNLIKKEIIINVFMEKNVDHMKIIEKISP